MKVVGRKRVSGTLTAYTTTPSMIMITVVASTSMISVFDVEQNFSVLTIFSLRL